MSELVIEGISPQQRDVALTRASLLHSCLLSWQMARFELVGGQWMGGYDTSVPGEIWFSALNLKWNPNPQWLP